MFWSRHLPWLVPLVALVCVALALEYFPGRRDEPAGPDEATRSAFAPESLDSRASDCADRRRRSDRRKNYGRGSFRPRSRCSGTANRRCGAGATRRRGRQRASQIAGGRRWRARPARRRSTGGNVGTGAKRSEEGRWRAAAEPGCHGADRGRQQLQAARRQKTGSRETHSGRVGPGRARFPSLEAACSKAETGDEIELRFSGRRESHPIDLGSRMLTISGGEGFQPIIVFRPAEPTEKDPVTYSRSMISVASRPLTLVNLAIELDVPRDVPADSWSMFQILGATQIRLDRCWLTIRNASDQLASYHPDVAFFRVKSPPGADPAVDPGAPSSPSTSITIKLTDSVARGEAAFLRTETLQPVDLSWENGLLATTECLLSAAGGAESPRAEDVRKIHLTHLTATLRGGLYRMRNTPSAAFQLPTRIESSDSIFLGLTGVPLVEQSGMDSAEESRRLLQWMPTVISIWVGTYSGP